MKKLFSITIILTAFIFAAVGQSPAKFSYEVKKIDSLRYVITIAVNIDRPWHIYSQDASAPVLPTTLQFAKNPLVEFKSKPVERGSLVIKHDDVFDTDLKYFDGKVEYVQEVILRTPVKTALTGSVTYMLCTDEQCIKPSPELFKVMLQ